MWCVLVARLGCATCYLFADVSRNERKAASEARRASESEPSPNHVFERCVGLLRDVQGELRQLLERVHLLHQCEGLSGELGAGRRRSLLRRLRLCVFFPAETLSADVRDGGKIDLNIVGRCEQKTKSSRHIWTTTSGYPDAVCAYEPPHIDGRGAAAAAAVHTAHIRIHTPGVPVVQNSERAASEQKKKNLPG